MTTTTNTQDTPATTNAATQDQAGQHHGQPVRWKLWLLLACCIYPIITCLELLAGPTLRFLPLPVQFAAVVPVMVATMVWGVLPQLHRWFGEWMTR